MAIAPLPDVDRAQIVDSDIMGAKVGIQGKRKKEKVTRSSLKLFADIIVKLTIFITSAFAHLLFSLRNFAI